MTRSDWVPGFSDMIGFPFDNFDDFKNACQHEGVLLGIHRITARNWVPAGRGIAAVRRTTQSVLSFVQVASLILVPGAIVACSIGRAGAIASLLVCIGVLVAQLLLSHLVFRNAREAVKEAIQTDEEILSAFWMIGALRIVMPDGTEYAVPDHIRKSVGMV